MLRAASHQPPHTLHCGHAPAQAIVSCPSHHPQEAERSFGQLPGEVPWSQIPLPRWLAINMRLTVRDCSAAGIQAVDAVCGARLAKSHEQQASGVLQALQDITPMNMTINADLS